MPKILADLLP